MWNPVRNPRLSGLKTPCPLQRISSSQCSPMTLNPVLNLRLPGLKGVKDPEPTPADFKLAAFYEKPEAP